MTPAVQSTIVFVVVAIATIYATLKFMPAAWRRSLASRVAAWAKRVGTSDVMARRVEAKLASGGACGSCESCRACAKPATTTVDAVVSSYRQIPIRRAS